MKKNDLTDTKALDIKALRERAKKLRSEVADLHLDKNMNKLADTKTIWKRRKDLAQVLTVLKQKELLAMFEPKPFENTQDKGESK
jgi:ribosomal protein L29